jgi:chromosome segregation ATPase
MATQQGNAGKDGRFSALSWAPTEFGDGTTRCTTSADEQVNPPPVDLPGGEELMEGFIQHFMLGILKPVAEHVRELESNVEEIKSKLRDHAQRHDELQSTCDTAADKVNENRLVLSKNTVRLDRFEMEIKQGSEERNQTILEAEGLKKDVTEIKMKLGTMQNSLTTTKGHCLELESQARAMKLEVASNANYISEYSEHLKSMKSGMQVAHDKHLDLVRDVLQCKQFSESNNRYIKILEGMFEHYRDDDMKNQKRVDEVSTRMEKDIETLRRNMEKETEQIRGAWADIYTLRQALDLASGTSNKLEGLTAKQEDAAQALEEQTRRMAVVSESMEKLSDSHVMSTHRTKERIEDMQRQLDGNASDITGLLKGHGQHEDHLRSHFRTQAERDAEAKRLAEHTDAVTREVKALVTWQKAAASEIEMHAMENFKVFSDLQQINDKLEGTNSDVRNLKNDLRTTEGTVGTLLTRFDATKQNIAGLSRGFQDTFKHVLSGDAGMLSPKSSQSTALPTLGGLAGGARASSRMSVTGPWSPPPWSSPPVSPPPTGYS